MWQNVDLTELRAFVAVCDELSFARAADRLGCSRSRVSQLVKSLETKVGTSLLVRTSRRVRIAPEGESLLAEIRVGLDHMEGALQATARAGASVTGTLRLGVVFSPAGGPHLERIMSAFEGEHPECRCDVSAAHAPDPLLQLRRGEVDLIAIRWPIEQPDVELGPRLSREERAVAVGATHPLAKRERVHVEALADYETHDGGGQVPAEMMDAGIPPYTPSGRRIRRREIAPERFDYQHLMSLVARGLIVHPSVMSMRDYHSNPRVRWLPLDGLHRRSRAWRGCAGRTRRRSGRSAAAPSASSRARPDRRCL